MIGRHLWLAVLLAFSASGCATADGAVSNADAVFVVVRHAEKVSDGSKDPPLSPAGESRAQSLAASLRDMPLEAAYATAYHRTQMTALPTAQAHALTVTTYDANQPAADFAAALRQDHRDGVVLVVGHSNTAPVIASALCGCAVAPMADDEFDRRLVIHIDADGTASLREDRY
jgi:broad specificity phosphatase PhoE